MPDYFTLAELRAMPDMASTTDYPSARCESASAYITGVIEREVGTSFVPRQVTDEIHDGDGTSYVVLKSGSALTAVSATVAGVAVTDTLIVRSGILQRLSAAGSPVAWPVGYANVKVTYMAGYSSSPPADVKEMALKGTRAHLLANASDSSMNDRRTSLNTDMGVIQFVVAGENRPTGYPEVDAMIMGWKARLDVFGFA